MHKIIRIFRVPVIALVLALAVIAVLTSRDLVDLSSKISLGQVLEIIILIVLVLVTYAYAWSADEQAKASVKMAKAMVKPRLIPEFCLEGDFDSERYVSFKAAIHSWGNGAAYDIKGEIQDEGKPPSILAIHEFAHVLVSHLDHQFLVSYSGLQWNGRLYFPKSEAVQKRFFVIKYMDIDGEYEIRQPFVLTTGEGGKPIAMSERPSRSVLKRENLEDENHDS